MASELAEAAKAIRADIKAAAKAGTLPPHPEGVTFRVRSSTASQCTEALIMIEGAPDGWAFSQIGDETRRTAVSEAALELGRALIKILRERWECNGQTRFGFVHLGDSIMIAAA